MKKIIAVVDPNAPADIQSILKDASQESFDSAQDALNYLDDLDSIEKNVAAIYATENLSDGSGIDFMIMASSIDLDYEDLQTIIVGDQTAISVQDVAIKRGITRWISDIDDLRSDLNVTVNDALEASFLEGDSDIDNSITPIVDEDDAVSALEAPEGLAANVSDDDLAAEEALLDDLDLSDSDDDIFETTSTGTQASTALLDMIDDDDDMIAGINDVSEDALEELIDEDEAQNIANQSLQESIEVLDDDDDISLDSLSDDTDELAETALLDDSSGESTDEASLLDDIAESLDLAGEEEEAIADSISNDDLSALEQELADVDDESNEDMLDESSLLDDIAESLDVSTDEDLAESISDDDLSTLEQELADHQSEDGDTQTQDDMDEAELMKEFEALMDSGEFEELAAVVDAEEATAASDAEVAAPETADQTKADDNVDFSYDNIDMDDNSYGNLAALVKEVSGGEEHELDLPDSTTNDIKKMINTRVQDAILDHGTVMLMASKDFARKYGSQQELLLMKHIDRLEKRIAELEAKIK